MLTFVVDITVEVYTLWLKERTKLKGLLEVISSSAEFETIPICRYEDSLLRRLYNRVLLNWIVPTLKHLTSRRLLSQARFSCLQLPLDFSADQFLVLEKVLNLLLACMDVLASDPWLNALGLWICPRTACKRYERWLKQIPHFEPEVRTFLCLATSA